MPRRVRENTLPSFEVALEEGAQGIELDVHVTLDGVVVVHHDEHLADGSAIDRLSWAEVQRRPAAPGIPIPSLAEVCDAIAGRATLFVELKGRGIETAVLEVLHRYGGDAAIHSFDHAMIGRLADLGCPWRTGILFEHRADFFTREVEEAMDATGALDVWPHFPLVTQELVDVVRARGGRVIPWTVNDADVARRLAQLGVDGLCGDDVTIFRGLPGPATAR